MWNLTIPIPNFSEYVLGNYIPASWSIAGADGNYVVLVAGASSPVTTGTDFFTMAAVNVAQQPMTTTYTTGVGGDTQHSTPGMFAWNENITIPAYDQTLVYPRLGNGGNIVFFDDSLLSITDYSESTGTLVWSDTPFNNDFATQDLPINDPPTVAYGMLYAADTDGYMHAINITNGVQQWDSITRSGGLEMPEPGYPANGAFVADNEVFTSSFIYYESTPAYRGHCLYAFNALTGAQNWNISGEYFGVTISDGILMAQNLYDGKEYAFTPGPTATTVSVSSGNAQVGVPTIIQGTVTDQTPGPAQGTPAISDAWMTPWMQYLYMDQPYPTSATGVNVQLTAIDSNNNLISIGNATSNLDGLYKYTWTPPNVPGSYTIIATFNSDNSYYGSCAEIATYVASATSATPAPTATPTTVADMYFVPAIAGLFVLIIIVAIVLALLMLRKKP
jgi:hypothetical protein